MRSVVLVWTDFGNVLAFAKAPDRVADEWHGIFLHPFMPRDVQALGVRSVLAEDEPRRVWLHETDRGDRWVFERTAYRGRPAGVIWRRRHWLTRWLLGDVFVLRFCGKFLRATGMHLLPVGARRYPVFEKEPLMSKEKEITEPGNLATTRMFVEAALQAEAQPTKKGKGKQDHAVTLFKAAIDLTEGPATSLMGHPAVDKALRENFDALVREFNAGNKRMDAALKTAAGQK